MSHCNICETEVHEERRTERICGLCHQEIIVKRTAQAKEQEEKKNKENYQKAVHRNERNKLAKINELRKELYKNAPIKNAVRARGRRCCYVCYKQGVSYGSESDRAAECHRLVERRPRRALFSLTIRVLRFPKVTPCY